MTIEVLYNKLNDDILVSTYYKNRLKLINAIWNIRGEGWGGNLHIKRYFHQLLRQVMDISSKHNGN